MTRLPWLWPAIIFFSAAAVAVVTYGNVGLSLRPLIAFWFLLVCPGMAFVRLLELKEGFAEWTLAIALSLALDAIVAGTMLYAGKWSPELGLIVLIAISLFGVVLKVVMAYSRMITAPAALDAAEQSGVPGKATRPLFSPRRLASIAVAALALLVPLLLWTRSDLSDAQLSAGQPETPALGQSTIVSAAVPAEPTATLVATPTSTPQTPIELLSPADSSQFNSEDDITFGWSYATPLEAGHQFVIYLLSGGGEAMPLGAVSTPLVNTRYHLVVKGDELGVPTGVFIWQVILEEVATGEELAASSLRTIRFLLLAPTPLPAATITPSVAPTATPVPTPCIVSPPSTWVQYTVKSGDILSVLAIEKGTTAAEAGRINCLENISLLSVGQVLWLPPLPATKTPAPTNTPLPSPTATEETPAPPPTAQSPVATEEPPTEEPPTEEPPTEEPPTEEPPTEEPPTEEPPTEEPPTPTPPPPQY